MWPKSEQNLLTTSVAFNLEMQGCFIFLSELIELKQFSFFMFFYVLFLPYWLSSVWLLSYFFQMIIRQSSVSSFVIVCWQILDTVAARVSNTVITK